MLLETEDTPQYIEKEGRLKVGHVYSVGITTENVAQIWGVEIYEKFRGKGHGKKMMQELLDELKAKEVERAWLYVEARNFVAMNLYFSLGFKITKQYREFAWEMEKEL